VTTIFSEHQEHQRQKDFAQKALALKQASAERQRPHVLAGYISLAELAADLGRSTRTIHRYLALPNGLPHVLLGNRLLFDPERVRAWIAARERVRNPTRRGGRRRE
jgi:hypothetical protein